MLLMVRLRTSDFLCVALWSLACFHIAIAEPVLKKEVITVGHVERTFFVQYPDSSAAQPAAGWPLVFKFHGWRGTASSAAEEDQFRAFGAGYAVVVHPEGWSDPTNPAGDLSWQSWNGGGASGAEAGGSQGPTCNPDAVTDGDWQCYASCKAFGYCDGTGIGEDRCRWAHCEDDVAFVLAALESVASQIALDRLQIYAAGGSNGGLFVYELASDDRSAGIFNALVAVSGLPSRGFNRGSAAPGIRFLEVAGTQDTLITPYPNVPEDPTESYGTCCGWYYSSWLNTTDLWAAQLGLALDGRTALFSPLSRFDCQGWSQDGTVYGADVASCFYDGGHICPVDAWELAWHFFGLNSSPAPTPSCAKTCSGKTCDEWYDYNGNTCAYEEQIYGCDCRGCKCKGGYAIDTV